MTVPTTPRETKPSVGRFLRIAAGAVVAATLMAAPAWAQRPGGHDGRGGRSFNHGAPANGFRGGWNGGHRGGWNSGNWNRGYVGSRWHGGGWSRPWGYRSYGPRFSGFGYHTDPYWAFPYIGLSAWNWAAYDALTEAEFRAQENALVTATASPLSDPVTWNDGSTSGTVTPLREGHTRDGRLCREFQQQITIAGKREQAFGTACQQSDGSWQIVDQADAQ